MRNAQEGVPDGYKRCSKCGEVKEVGAFDTSNHSKDGHRQPCKCCRHAEYLSVDKETIRAYGRKSMAKWRKNNPEKEKQARVRAYNKNKEEINRRHREYYYKNKERFLEYGSNYREKNQKKILEYSRRNIELITAKTFFQRNGIMVRNVPADLLSSKVLQIKLIRAIKAHKEGHKEVKNGKT